VVKVVHANKLLICLIGFCLLAAAGSVFSQEERARPSWSEEVKKTDIPDAPEDEDRPEMEFSVDRSALQGDMPTFDRTPQAQIATEEPEVTPPPVVNTETSMAAEAQQQEVVDVPVDPAPEPVAAETENQDKRLVSLDPPANPVERETSPAATAEAANEGFTLVRSKSTQPDYPRQALLNSQEGWVDLLVTVSSAGKVENVQIVAAEPRRVFERAAIRAARKWEFVPPIDSGVTTSQTGNYRVTFVMN
jgi:protein TonB